MLSKRSKVELDTRGRGRNEGAGGKRSYLGRIPSSQILSSRKNLRKQEVKSDVRRMATWKGRASKRLQAMLYS